MRDFTVAEIKAIGEWAIDNFNYEDKLFVKSGFEDTYVLVSQNDESYTVYKLSEILKDYQKKG